MCITISGISPGQPTPKHAFIYDSGEKLTALGIHRLKADPTVQKATPRTVPVQQPPPAKPAKAMPTLHTLGIARRTHFQSSSPCSLLSMTEGHQDVQQLYFAEIYYSEKVVLKSRIVGIRTYFSSSTGIGQVEKADTVGRGHEPKFLFQPFAV